MRGRTKDPPDPPDPANGGSSPYANMRDGGKGHSDTSSAPSPSSPTSALPDAEAVDHEGMDDVMMFRDDVYYNDDIYMTSEAAGLRLDRVQQDLLDRLRAENLGAEFAVGSRWVLSGLVVSCRVVS